MVSINTASDAGVNQLATILEVAWGERVLIFRAGRSPEAATVTIGRDNNSPQSLASELVAENTKQSYKNYLLTLLCSILAFNFVDRLALGLLLQDIKRDLVLSDTQLGLLTGIAFSLFFSIAGVPLARWADRGDRSRIVSITTLVWSGAMALCGLAGTFVQLLAIRVGVAVGASSVLPTAHSLIGSYFTRAERPRATSRYMLGAPLSAVVGYFLAGWLSELYGWRMTFFLLGLPGAVLSVLAWFTLKEPRQKAKELQIVDTATGVGSGKLAASESRLWEVCATLWSNKTFRHLLIGYTAMVFISNAIVRWQPAFFARTYELRTGELGMWFALIYGAGGLLGTYLGGEWASRFAANNEQLQVRVAAFLYASFAVVKVLVFAAPNYYLAFALLSVTVVANGIAHSPLLATIQTLVPDRMRATAFALIYLCSNLIGMGFGPLTVGVLSDLMLHMHGDQSLRYALLLASPGYLVCAWYLWKGSRTVMHDVQVSMAQKSPPGS